MYNKSNKKTPRAPLEVPLLWAIVPYLVGGAAILLARVNPQQTELVYSRDFYWLVVALLSGLGLVFPFSNAEILLLTVVPFAAAMILYFFLKILTKWRDSAAYAKRALTLAAFFVGLVFAVYGVACAPNYYRQPLEETLGYSTENITRDELYTLNSGLIKEANRLWEQCEHYDTGLVMLPDEPKYEQTRAAVHDTYKKLSAEYPIFFDKPYPKPKLVSFSPMLSSLQLTGFFFPYTMEANVNTYMPPYQIPYSIAHELAHLHGFMREEEASFIGYYVCTQSGNAPVAYAGVMEALSASMNALYSVDPAAYRELAAGYLPGVAADISYADTFWRGYDDTFLSELSNDVNDTYLKANGQSAGTGSYSEIVRLLVGQQRAGKFWNAK